MEIEPEISFNDENDIANLQEKDKYKPSEICRNDTLDNISNNTNVSERICESKNNTMDCPEMCPEMDVDVSDMVQNLLESRNPEISPLQCSECDLECPSLSALKFHTQLHVMERMVQSSYKYPGVGLKKPSDKKRRRNSSKGNVDEARDIETMMESLVSHSQSKSGKLKKDAKKNKSRKTYKSKGKKTVKRKGKGKKTYKCVECDSRFKLKKNLKVHMLTHPNSKRFACIYCGYRCSKNALLTRHMLTHTGAKPYACPLCDYKCNDKGNLAKHMVIHGDDKPFSCPEENCDYKCKLKCNLKSHMLKHSGEKPHACQLCDYSSVFKGDLTTHMYKHTGERPFPCPVCGKGYTSKNNLKVHMRTHTDDKKFKCEHCDFRFYTQQKLNQHIMTHTGEKPHECDACGIRFSRRSNLNKHMKTHITGRVRQRRQSKPKNDLTINVNSLTNPIFVARKPNKVSTNMENITSNNLVPSYSTYGLQSVGSSQLPYDLSQHSQHSQHSEVSNDSSQVHLSFHQGNAQSLNNQHNIGSNSIIGRNSQENTHLNVNHKNDSNFPSSTKPLWHQGNSNIPAANAEEYHYQNFIDKLLQTRQQAGENLAHISQNYSHTPLAPHPRPMYIDSAENTHLNSKIPSTMPVPPNMSQMIRNANYMYNIQ